MTTDVLPPDISVIIPVHNAASTLVEQLDAVESGAAEAPRYEIIVVDNRSTDDSARVAREWASTHGVDLRVIDAHEQPGEPFARNVGLRAARAERVAFCDADDRVTPTWLASMAAALDSADYATGPIDMDTLNPPWIANVRGRAVVTGRSQMYELVPYAHGCNMGFRRDTLLAIGGFDESYLAGCDLDIAVRMWEHGYELEFSDGAGIHYRLRPSLRSTYHQGVFYGRYRTRIRHRLTEAAAMPARDPRNTRRLAWLVKMLPATFVSRSTRARWIWVTGQLVGEARGNREFRTPEPVARRRGEAVHS
jgi:glycosyltransferase involved in cell wall biosynthesis